MRRLNKIVCQSIIWRYDTVDSKILNTYGIFIKRDNPELVYFKSGSKPDFFQDLSNNSAITNYGKNQFGFALFRKENVFVYKILFTKTWWKKPVEKTICMT